MITSERLSHTEYVAWRELLRLLGLSSYCWDLERFGNSLEDSSGSAPWLNRCRIVVWPAANEAELNKLRADTLLAHMRAHRDSGLLVCGVTARALDMALFGNVQKQTPAAIEYNEHELTSCAPWLMGSSVTKRAFERAHRERLASQARDPMRIYKAIYDTSSSASIWCGCRTSLGKLSLYRSRLPRRSNLVLISDACLLPSLVHASSVSCMDTINTAMTSSAEAEAESWIDRHDQRVIGEASDAHKALQKLPASSSVANTIFSMLRLLPVEERVFLLLQNPPTEKGSQAFSLAHRNLPLGLAHLVYVSLCDDVEQEFRSGPPDFPLTHKLSNRLAQADPMMMAPVAPLVAAIFQRTIDLYKLQSLLPWPGRQYIANRRRVLKSMRDEALHGLGRDRVPSRKGVSSLMRQVPRYDELIVKGRRIAYPCDDERDLELPASFIGHIDDDEEGEQKAEEVPDMMVRNLPPPQLRMQTTAAPPSQPAAAELAPTVGSAAVAEHNDIDEIVSLHSVQLSEGIVAPAAAQSLTAMSPRSTSRASVDKRRNSMKLSMASVASKAALSQRLLRSTRKQRSSNDAAFPLEGVVPQFGARTSVGRKTTSGEESPARTIESRQGSNK